MLPGATGAHKDRPMKRCMFVDDSSVVRKVAKRILGSPELIVIEASTGAEALDMCQHDMPEIIVVDSGLPDMTAVEFIKRAGAQGYLLKPFNRAQLLERFRQLQAA